MALHSGGTASDRIQSGTTAQRPTSTEVGQIRFNTTTGDIEFWRGDRWVPVRPPVTNPISDTDRTIGLKYDKGLRLTGDNLEAHIREGLTFNADGSIRVVPDGDISLAYEPIIESYPSTDFSYENVGGPSSPTNLPGSKLLSVNPPAESNAAFCIMMVKMAITPVPGGGKYLPDFDECHGRGNWRAIFGGARNCYAISAGDQTRIGATVALNAGFKVQADGSADTSAMSESWNMKFEELRWDKNSSGAITFDLGWKDWVLNTARLEYGAVRLAVMPYSIS